MAIKKKHIVLRISISLFLLIVVSVASLLLWLSYNYKHIILSKLPAVVEKSTDTLYHISLQDININFITGNVVITGLKLWPDKKQAVILRKRHIRIPTTLSTVDLPLAELSGISWTDIFTHHSIDCDHIVVSHLKWLMEATPHPEDSLFPEKKKPHAMIMSISAVKGNVVQPDITYKYEGKKTHFTGRFCGGTGQLDHFVYDIDDSKDTENFLYAKSGSVRPDSFIFIKTGSHYQVKKPRLDFETGLHTQTLKSVNIEKLTDISEATGKLQEFYNLDFPFIEIVGMNWNKLIDDGILRANEINARKPVIDIHYISADADTHGKMGDYPNQQLHEVGLKTNIMSVHIKEGLFRYTEPNEKSKQEGVIELEQLDCRLTNITNLDSVIRKNDNCAIKLKAKYNHKSDVAGTIDLTLGDTKGHFTMEGYLENLDAADVTKQTQAFALFEVTSLHMSRIEVKEGGDETYVAGDLTMLYQDLKISVLKFKTNLRKNRRGPLSFLANTLVLYPDNPMKGKEVRSVTTTFARDTTKGFISMIWENILRGAKKTAIRSDALINLVDGPETTKGEKPKKGFFTRLFGKKHNK